MSKDNEWQTIQVSGFLHGKHPIRFKVGEPWEPELTSEWFTPRNGLVIRNCSTRNSEVTYWRAYDGNPPKGAQGWRLKLWFFKQRLLKRCTKKHKSL